MTGNDIEDVRTDMMAAIAEDCCTLVAMAKERQTNVTQVVYVDANHNDAVASVYGHTIHVWRAGDTMDGLASDLLGNPDLGPLIAYFNKIGDEASIEAGTRIKIPCLTETAASRGNMIYAQPGGHDGYGADMRIGEDGDLAAAGGDAAVIAGQDNLAQAVADRLATSSARRIRLSSYGIRSTIGDPMAVQSYLLAAIEQTLKEDPRIAEVNGVSFRGNGDRLYIEVEYTDINGGSGKYRGEI